MRHSIRTLGVPTRTGSGAFIVVPARSSTASFNGQNVVTGAPGTVPIHAPRPAAMRDDSWGASVQPSGVSPDFILPSIYVSHFNSTMQRATRLIGRRSPNLVPVPAGKPNMIPANFSKGARIGGQTVTSARRPFIKWPTYGGR